MKMIDFCGTLAGAHHAQIAAARRRERLVVLERRRDVLVPGQGVEVLFLVVVQRRLVAHPPVDLVRIVEVLLARRGEHHFGLGHCVLLGAEGYAGYVTEG